MPTDTGTINTPKVFSVSTDVFRRFSMGRNRFERWNKFLDKDDTYQCEIQKYIRVNRNNLVVLKDETTGAMISVRRRSSNGI